MINRDNRDATSRCHGARRLASAAAIAHCEHYKKNPALARKFIEEVPNALIEKLAPRKKFLVFKPLAQVADETPEVIIFLANAEQISGLVTLANYDSSTPDVVKILFGAGCAQVFLYPLTDKNLLAFSMSYEKFLQLEACAADSFLTTETWQKLMRRAT